MKKNRHLAQIAGDDKTRDQMIRASIELRAKLARLDEERHKIMCAIQVVENLPLPGEGDG